MWPWRKRCCSPLAVVAGHGRAGLCVHPDTEIWLGVTDLLADSKPTRTIAPTAPSSEGFHFDPEKAWSDRDQVFKMDKRVLKTRNVVQSAEGHPKGTWSTVVALGVFIF